MEAETVEREATQTAALEVDEILRQFASARTLPVEAIAAARARRAEAAPAFLRLVEAAADGRAEMDYEPSPLFYVFHMLGEWRETAAYPPLARLLRADPDLLEHWLGDAVTESAARVMAAVFDGDPEPLRQAALDPRADGFAREVMFTAMVILVLEDRLDRAQTARFLRDCFMELRPHKNDQVWVAWAQAVAWLGLREFRSLARKAFDRGFIDRFAMSYEDFRRDLYAFARPGAEPTLPGMAFGDTVEELTAWLAYTDPDETGPFDGAEARDDELAAWLAENYALEQATNPYRHVGRNDPCPCVSGRKFKKCCMP